MKEKTISKGNKMGIKPISKLIWQMGLPMIVSMVLQAVYNIVDTAFVVKSDAGEIGNLALTYAFPIQLLIIAVGVGTGVGINAMLSKSLGEKDKKKLDRTAGNGIFLALCTYVIFLLFGLVGSKWFISMQVGNVENANAIIEMGTQYLTIVSCVSFGAIGYTIFERFLQSTGKTMLSTISQITGAVTNIVLDYVFIYPCGMGIAGAAWATVIGQILSLAMAMIFHYSCNKEIGNHPKNILPNWSVLKGIFKVGISAMLMQALLAVMMFGMNLILSTAKVNSALLAGSFGIYYKIMQFALFAMFGISNTIISILSFNFGMGNKQRSKECIKWGIVMSVIVAVVITILFEACATPFAQLFSSIDSSSGEGLVSAVTCAIRISAISYVFMGVSVAIQGVLQAFRDAWRPLIISLLRLCVLVLPIAWLFTLSNSAIDTIWWTFLIVEVITAAVAVFFLWQDCRKFITPMQEEKFTSENLIITISREHGSNGKQIGKLVAEKLGVKFFDKEILAEVAKQTGLAKEYLSNAQESVTSFNSTYLSTEVNQKAIIAQAEVIRKIASEGNCVIVGRGADHILKDCPNLVKVFVYANDQFKIETVKKLYGDDEESAKKNIKRANNARSIYYNFISGKTWGDKANYDLCVDSSNGVDQAVDTIVSHVQNSKPQTAAIAQLSKV